MSEDTSWVFDSLVCFLHGPVWNAPLQTFVEEKSLIFDPNERSDITNPEYVRIHEEYKGLVDFMLGSFMEEMQISAAQFEVACLENRQHQQTATSSSSGNAFSFHQGLFQQIWAANDIRIFVRMMTQRNVELQLQALELIQHRQQNLTDADAGKSDLFQASDNVVADVADDDVDDTPHQLSTNDDTASERQLFESIEKVLRNENDRNTEVENASSDTNHDEVTVEDKFQRLNLFFEKEKIDSADVQSRQQYLRAQRDKILAAKKKVRAHQLNESVRKTGRPGSAQSAAQAILAKGSSAAMDSDGGQAAQQLASIQLRQTLARRLRTEVVEGDV